MFGFLNNILGFYANCGIAWIVTVATDIVVNKYLLKISPKQPEFRRGMLYAVNPVGLVSVFGAARCCRSLMYFHAFGDALQPYSPIVAAAWPSCCTPLMAVLTRGKLLSAPHRRRHRAADVRRRRQPIGRDADLPCHRAGLRASRHDRLRHHRSRRRIAVHQLAGTVLRQNRSAPAPGRNSPAARGRWSRPRAVGSGVRRQPMARHTLPHGPASARTRAGSFLSTGSGLRRADGRRPSRYPRSGPPDWLRPELGRGWRRKFRSSSCAPNFATFPATATWQRCSCQSSSSNPPMRLPSDLASPGWSAARICSAIVTSSNSIAFFHIMKCSAVRKVSPSTVNSQATTGSGGLWRRLCRPDAADGSRTSHTSPAHRRPACRSAR